MPKKKEPEEEQESEEIEESELEEELEEEPKIDEKKLLEFLQPSVKSISPVLEQVAIAPEATFSLEQDVGSAPILKKEDDEKKYETIKDATEDYQEDVRKKRIIFKLPTSHLSSVIMIIPANTCFIMTAVSHHKYQRLTPAFSACPKHFDDIAVFMLMNFIK